MNYRETEEQYVSIAKFSYEMGAGFQMPGDFHVKKKSNH